jgi:endonuclease III
MEDRIREVHAALVAEHGEPEPPRSRPPIDYLVHTILSQNTADENRDAAWDSQTRRRPGFRTGSGPSASTRAASTLSPLSSRWTSTRSSTPFTGS